ncbi:MAG: sugar ABC transporter substrate-binding protein [Lachnospiraceae bacterium]|nr:sugar ABC transporter substrate-binding protein [Lachnospiraceae bacterium]
MSLTKRVLAALVCLMLLCWGILVAMTGNMTVVNAAPEEVDNDSLVVWYTDEALTDYINAACVSYNEKYGTRVVPRLQSGDEYLEHINKASVADEGTPDVYIVTNDVLERAFLCGLATVVNDESQIVTAEYFPPAALHAVTYKDRPVAYPFYFETSALLYNRTYLYEMAKNQIMAEESSEPEEAGSAEGEDAEAVEDPYEGLTEEEKIELKLEESIPNNFDEFLEFANTCDAPPDVEAIFKWDVKDVFYNYFFVGNYINVGGPNGDDTSVIDIYNMNAITAMSVYQSLNQFFSFDYEDISYDSVIDEFMSGKLVFTTATTDIVNKLEKATADGEFAFEYGIAELPDTTEVLESKSMSVTNVAVVNWYSDKKKQANSFARYLTVEYAGNLYDKAGKLPATNKVTFENEAIKQFVLEYADSVPVPKMMAASNYWLQAEITFANIWSGKNVSEELKDLSEQIKAQVTGMDISEDYINVPVEDQGETEYYDEEALKQEAQEEDSEEDNGENFE